MFFLLSKMAIDKYGFSLPGTTKWTFTSSWTFRCHRYTEMDFRNEALNAARMTDLLAAAEFGASKDHMVIPQPVMELTTRCRQTDRQTDRQ
jgi:hypothetical protein